MNSKNLLLSMFLFLFALIPNTLMAETDAVKIDLTGGRAVVTLLQGKASLIKKGMTIAQSLVKGDYLRQGDRVNTEKRSRIEIKLPDESLVRFDELTTFELAALSVNKRKKDRNINVRMIFGKAWAKVTKWFGKKGRFALSTKTAVAGVRGTVYRVNVNPDNSAIVKVYGGEVAVSNMPPPARMESPAKVESPSPVDGPKSVDGPHPVSMKEWTHIVRSMQELVVRPDGSATKPFRFTLAADSNDWVRWNQSLDEKVGE
jgi:hypothetical protein